MNDAVWPDPGEWVARLNDKLVQLDTQYYGFNEIRRMRLDPDNVGNDAVADSDPQANATQVAAAALAVVVSALREIPTFQGNVGLTAVSDVARALSDLDLGHRPALLQPRAGQSSPGDSIGRRILKAHVVLCVELLELSGRTNASARKAIADIFSAAGLGGRKGKLLSAKSIYDWGTALAAHGADPEGRRIIESAIRQWKEKRSWPPKEQDVLIFAREKAEDPALRTII